MAPGISREIVMAEIWLYSCHLELQIIGVNSRFVMVIKKQLFSQVRSSEHQK